LVTEGDHDEVYRLYNHEATVCYTYLIACKGVNINVYIQHSQEATIRSGLNTYGDFNSSPLLILMWLHHCPVTIRWSSTHS